MQDAAELQWTLLPLWMSFVPYLLLHSIASSLVFTLANKKRIEKAETIGKMD
ncbi:hypothetical protein Smp_133220 [Schistosoma mansoni]|uniref:hypothetical protein n=1 Tax=Schistosoma mansoni TaxID=6183 RepID=UPI0001A632CA|nr:hypothetical protein Smp_133220 [Schistosoma mansoni]|eukprot:XP_018647941.1 hypothetical protein Smp_133220 [Schistosoma mansoni]